MISATKLTLISPKITGQRAIEIALDLDIISPLYGINTPNIFHEFISNVLHECGGFTIFGESLNYQSVALTKLFGRHRISLDDCYRYGRTLKQKANQQAIANIIYGGDWGKINLGNTKPNDGWSLRGSGAMQLTGVFMIGGFADYYNKRFGTKYSMYDMADFLRTDLKISIHGACWLFAISKKLIKSSIEDKFDTVVKSINGGINGMADRKKYYELAKKYIV